MTGPGAPDGAALTRATGRLGTVAVVGAALCWGSVVVLIKIAARGLPIATISVIEVATALVGLALLLAARRTPVRFPGRIAVLVGVLEPGLAYPLINAGLARTSGAHGAVIIGLESVAVVAGDAAWRRTRPSGRVMLAVVLASAGAALVTSSDGSAPSVAGDLLVAAGVLLAAGYVLVAARHLAGVDAVAATFWQFAAGGLTVALVSACAAALPGSPPLWGEPMVMQVACAVAAGLLGSAVAFLLYNWALNMISPALAGVSLTLVPVFGIAFSAAALGEAISVQVAVGAAAVLVGTAMVSA